MLNKCLSFPKWARPYSPEQLNSNMCRQIREFFVSFKWEGKKSFLYLSTSWPPKMREKKEKA